MPSSLGTCTQLLLEYVGQDLVGQVIFEETKLSLNSHSIVITHTVSCARSSDTEATTEDNPKPSPCKTTSPSRSSLDFSPNTSLHSQPTFDGTVGLITSYDNAGGLQRLLDEKDGSLDVGMIQLPSGKRLHIILKDHLPTS